MAKFFKNNSIVFRHCLLYELLQEKRVKKAFADFRKTVGDDFIGKEDIQFCFDEFRQGKLYKKPVDDKREILRNDKYALRACILYESLKFRQVKSSNEIVRDSTFQMYINICEGVENVEYDVDEELLHKIRCNPSFSFYKNFCNVIGDDAMDYSEFDFWFYRFVNGEFDFIYEREEVTTYELLDMPLDVMENIVKNLNIFDRLALARTSRSLLAFIQNQKLFHNSVVLDVYCSDVNINFIGSPVYNFIGYEGIPNSGMRGVSVSQEAFLDLKNFFKNPKLHLDTLRITFMSDHPNLYKFLSPCTESKNELEAEAECTRQLNVEKLIYLADSMEHLLKLLPYFKPGYLTTIQATSRYSFQDATMKMDKLEMEKIAELEQWKQAKYFIGHRFSGPLHLLFHLKEFEITLNEFTLDDASQMKEVLFKSPDFEKCSISVDDTNFPVIMKSELELGGAIQMNYHTLHYPIPKSTEYFEIDFLILMEDDEVVSYYQVIITRKKI